MLSSGPLHASSSLDNSEAVKVAHWSVPAAHVTQALGRDADERGEYAMEFWRLSHAGADTLENYLAVQQGCFTQHCLYIVLWDWRLGTLEAVMRHLRSYLLTIEVRRCLSCGHQFHFYSRLVRLTCSSIARPVQLSW